MLEDVHEVKNFNFIQFLIKPLDGLWSLYSITSIVVLNSSLFLS